MGPRSALLSHSSLLLEIRATILPTGTWQHNLDRNLLDRRLWLLMKAFPLLPHRTKVFMLPETAPSFHRNWFSNTLNSHRQAPGSKNKMQKSGWLLETLPDERLPAINQLILLFSGEKGIEWKLHSIVDAYSGLWGPQMTWICQVRYEEFLLKGRESK